MITIGSKELPCGHQRINEAAEGRIVRCRTCKRKWTIKIEPAHPHTSEMLGDEVMRLRFDPIETAQPALVEPKRVSVKPTKRRGKRLR